MTNLPRYGPTTGTAIDLSTARVEHRPPADLTVACDHASAVSFQRYWLTNLAVEQYGSGGLSRGWVHSWDILLQDVEGTETWRTLELVQPGGHSDSLVPVLDDDEPTGAFTVPADAAYSAAGVPSGTPGLWDSITLTYCDQSTWVFTWHEEDEVYQIVSRGQRGGAAVDFHWDAARRLTSITDAYDDSALLTLSYDEDGHLERLVDRFDRRVDYTWADCGTSSRGATLWGIETVSQVVEVDAETAPMRWTYGWTVATAPPIGDYGYHPHGDWDDRILLLGTIDTPEVNAAPTTSRATLVYYGGQHRLASLADASGGLRRYLTMGDTGMLANVLDAAGNVIESEGWGFNEAGGQTGGTAPGTPSTDYADERFPDKPTSVTTADWATTTYTYDEQGNVATVTDPLGRVTTNTYAYCDAGQGLLKTSLRGNVLLVSNTYSLDGLLTASADAYGYINSYTYDDAGQPLTETDPLGATTSTTWDAGGRLLTRTNPLGATWTYSYDERGNRVAEMDPNGAVTTWTHDLQDRMIARMGPQGCLWTTVYGPTDAPLASVDPLGQRNTTIYAAEGARLASLDPLGIRATLHYDAAGKVIASEDALGQRTSAVYNKAGQAIASIDALGQRTTRVYDSAGRVVATENPLGARTSQVYDSLGRPAATMDPSGALTTTVYDADGRPAATINALGEITTTIYDAAGTPVAMANALGGRTTLTRDIAGRMVAMTDPLGNTTTTVYDAAGRPIAQVNALGERSTTVYDAAGRAVASVDPLGEVTTTSYCGCGRPSATTNALGQTTAYVYDLADRLIATVDPLGQRNTTLYDAASRPVARMDALGRLTTTVYDAASRVTAQVDARGGVTGFALDAVGRRVAFVDPNGHAWTTVYDAAGRAVGEIDPKGQRTTSTYDARGSRVGQVDARGWTTTLAYDALAREIERVGADLRITTTYDALGRVVAKVDAAGYTTHTYDMGSRLTSVELPLGKSLSYGYNAAGRRTRLVDTEGGLTTYAYDAAGRLRSVLNPFAETTTWLYDAVGRQVNHILGNGVSEATAYDAAGRPILRTHTNADSTLLGCYTATYDAAGNRLRVEELDGTFEYGYDASNQLIAEQRVGSHAYGITYTYDPAGNRLAIDQAGAAARNGYLGTTEYAYNVADELLTVTPPEQPLGEVSLDQQVEPPLTAPAYALTLPLDEGFVYTLDTATLDVIGASGTWDTSNHWQLALTARDDAGIVSTLATSTYAAAGAGQVALTPPAPVTLDADATPRLGVSVSKVGTPPPLVGLAGTASLAGALKPTTYAYDANGNTVNVTGPTGTVTLTWDAENRLVGAAGPDGTETYDYDSTTSVPGKVTGLRRSKTTGSGTTYFVWDQQNLLAELDGALARVSQYTDWPGEWGGLSSARAGGASQYFGFDLSANTRAMFGALGAVDQTALYSAFGPMLAGKLSQPFGFGGQVQYYSDGRWLQVRARELEVQTGRWLSRDPLGRFDEDWPSGYVGNGPVLGLDANGLFIGAFIFGALAGVLQEVCRAAVHDVRCPSKAGGVIKRQAEANAIVGGLAGVAGFGVGNMAAAAKFEAEASGFISLLGGAAFGASAQMASNSLGSDPLTAGGNPFQGVFSASVAGGIGGLLGSLEATGSALTPWFLAAAVAALVLSCLVGAICGYQEARDDPECRRCPT